jgi:hypothetical protein
MLILSDVNTTVDYKPILKCVIFGFFYFHPTTCFDLSISSCGFYEFHVISELFIALYYLLLNNPGIYVIHEIHLSKIYNY